MTLRQAFWYSFPTASTSIYVCNLHSYLSKFGGLFLIDIILSGINYSSRLNMITMI